MKRRYFAFLLAILCFSAVYYMKAAERNTAISTNARISCGRYRLVIDAGHGGEDGGAVSLSGVAESSINLAIAQKLDCILGFYGVNPVLLRDSDRSLHDPEAATLREKKRSDLRNRVTAIEGTPNAALISIHQNTYPNGRYHGAQVFYRDEDSSLPLAQLAQAMLSQALDPSNGRTPAKIPDTIYLMKHITCPAILVECGFLSNPEEEALLRSDGYQKKIAAALTATWLNYEVSEENNKEAIPPI